jgi:hypothetical protein
MNNWTPRPSSPMSDCLGCSPLAHDDSGARLFERSVSKICADFGLAIER